MKESLEKILNLLIVLAILAIVFVVPVYFSLFFITNDVFELNKSVILNILVLFLVWLTALKYLFFSDMSGPKALFMRPEIKMIFLLILIFLASFGLSTCLSIDRSASFHGLYDRGQGIITYFHLLAFYITLIFNLSFPKAEGLSGIQGKSVLNSGFAMTVRYPSSSRLAPVPPDSNRDGNNNKVGGDINKEANEGKKEGGNGKGETGSLFWVLCAIAAAGFVSASYGLLQAGGWDFLPWTESTQTRATSTFGQPNSLGSFFLFTLPVSIYLFFTSRRLIWRIAAGGAALTQFFAFVFTYSMSSWLGFLAGLFAVLSAWFFFRRFYNLSSWSEAKRSDRILSRQEIFVPAESPAGDSAAVLKHGKVPSGKLGETLPEPESTAVSGKYLKYVALAGALLLIIVFASNNFFNPGVFRLKLKNLFDPQAGSTAARTQFWSASWAGVKERPIFGHGPETQADVIVKNYEPDWAVYSNANVMPNRAHNLILDLLLTQGIIGLAAFLALFIYIIKLVIGNIRSRREPGLNYVLLFALIGYFIYLQFNFHHLTTLAYFFLFAALAVLIRSTPPMGAINPSLDGHDNKLKQPDSRPTQADKPGQDRNSFELSSLLGFTFFAKLFFIIALSAGIFILSGRQIDRLVADHYFFRLREAHATQELFTTFVLYDYVKEKSLGFSYYDAQYAFMLADWVAFLDDHPFTRIVKERLAALYARMPDNNYTQVYLKGVAAAALADTDNPRYFEEAENYFAQAIALSPDMPKNYRELGMMLNKKGEYERAIEALKTGLTKLPDLDNPYMNALHRSRVEREMYLNLLRLGDAYAGLDRGAEAIKYYEDALAKNPYDSLINKKLSGLYKKAGDYETAIWYIEMGSDITPQDYYWSYTLALIYEELGEAEKAEKYAKQALKLAPDNEDVLRLNQEFYK